MHLAQLNIGRFRYPTDDPRMAEFMDNLDRVNAIADRSEGFVWRLQDETGNATNLRIGDDYAVNLSVWKTAEALEQFVFRTVHVQFYKKRAAWFDVMDTPHMVMWWVEEGISRRWMRPLSGWMITGPTARASAHSAGPK